MPNHVINKLHVSGTPESVRDLLISIQNDKDGPGTIDFNKIIPMPESLNIEAGSDTEKGLSAYTDFVEIYTLAFSDEDTDPEHIPERSEKAFLRTRPEITPRQWELGKTAYRNRSLYGAPTWYEWSVNNWGTKWNAYECMPCEVYDDSAELSFWTAWSPPHHITQRLSEQYPDILFTHEWADEDIGRNCGRIEYINGGLLSEYYAHGKEAVDFANRLWDIDPEDEFTFNDGEETPAESAGDDEQSGKELKTQAMTDEKLEVVEVLGQTALFTNGRVTQKELPEGLYTYDLREGESIAFATVEPCVAVNHAGTIITKEPIIFGEEGYIAFDDDSSPDFLGDHMSIEEFLNTDFSHDEDETQTTGGMQL